VDDFIDNLANHFIFIIYPDIEDKIVFFTNIMSMSHLILILFVSFVDSSLGNVPGQLESIFGVFVEHIDIEVEQEDKRNIYKQIGTSRYSEESTELIQETLV